MSGFQPDGRSSNLLARSILNISHSSIEKDSCFSGKRGGFNSRMRYQFAVVKVTATSNHKIDKQSVIA